MNYGKTVTIVSSASVGALIMYLADPVSGRRRLSLVGDQVTKANHRLGRAVRGKSEDIKNRLYGLYCETRRLLTGISRQPAEESPVRDAR